MKSNRIYRTSRTQPATAKERSRREKKAVGRVSRVPHVLEFEDVRPEKPREKSEEVWPDDGSFLNRRNRLPLPVRITLELLFLIGSAGLTWFWILPKIDHNLSHGGEKRPGAPAATKQEESHTARRIDPPSREDALKIVKNGLSVRDPGMVEEHFRTGGSKPDEVVAFLKSLEAANGAFSEYKWLSSMDASGLLLEGVKVTCVSGGEKRGRLVLLTPDEKGRWKIDFESFARLAKPSWNELMEKKSDQGTVRVLVSKDNYYNGPFKDESQWICYGLASPDLDQILTAYCRRNSPQAAALARILSDGEELAASHGVNRATLEISRVEGAESRQFEITRVLAEDWVLPEKPFDEKFK